MTLGFSTSFQLPIRVDKDHPLIYSLLATTTGTNQHRQSQPVTDQRLWHISQRLYVHHNTLTKHLSLFLQLKRLAIFCLKLTTGIQFLCSQDVIQLLLQLPVSFLKAIHCWSTFLIQNVPTWMLLAQWHRIC